MRRWSIPARWADLVASACACAVAAMKAIRRIADGLLHRVCGAAVECHPVDDRLDDDSAAHELADRVHHVRVVTPQAVNPANDERVACAQHVEKPLALGALREP